MLRIKYGIKKMLIEYTTAPETFIANRVTKKYTVGKISI